MLALALLNYDLPRDRNDPRWLRWHLGWGYAHLRLAVDPLRPVDLSSIGIACRNVSANNAETIRDGCRRSAAEHLDAARAIARAIDTADE